MIHYNVSESKGQSLARYPAVRSILLVCTANQCRSPVAEALLKRQLQRAGIRDSYRVASAGTAICESGRRPDWRMRWLAWRQGIRLQSRSRQVNRRDLDRFDLVLAMDRSNWIDLQQVHSDPRGRVAMFSEFLPETDQQDSIADPTAGSWDAYRETWKLLEKGTACIAGQLTARRSANPLRIRALQRSGHGSKVWGALHPASLVS